MDEELVTALLLAKVLVADGMMATAEKARLSQAMTSLALDAAQREQVLSLTGMDEAITAARALSPEKRRALVDRLVEAALADGKLSPLELAEVRALSDALGV